MAHCHPSTTRHLPGERWKGREMGSLAIYNPSLYDPIQTQYPHIPMYSIFHHFPILDLIFAASKMNINIWHAYNTFQRNKYEMIYWHTFLVLEKQCCKESWNPSQCVRREWGPEVCGQGHVEDRRLRPVGSWPIRVSTNIVQCQILDTGAEFSKARYNIHFAYWPHLEETVPLQLHTA